MLLKEFKDLRRKPDKRIGTPDLFNFAFIGAPGVMVLKDGALMTCLTYQGPDLNSASLLEISALKHHLNAILSRYGDGFMIHADLIRHPSTEYPTGGAFPDRDHALIERERELHYLAEGKHLETSFTLSLTYRPPSDYQSRATRPFLSRHGEDKPDWHRTLETFQDAAVEFEQALSNHLRVRRKDDGEMLSFLESLHSWQTDVCAPAGEPQLPRRGVGKLPVRDRLHADHRWPAHPDRRAGRIPPGVTCGNYRLPGRTSVLLPLVDSGHHARPDHGRAAAIRSAAQLVSENGWISRRSSKRASVAPTRRRRFRISMRSIWPPTRITQWPRLTVGGCTTAI